jgi:hypothetical protein
MNKTQLHPSYQCSPKSNAKELKREKLILALALGVGQGEVANGLW